MDKQLQVIVTPAFHLILPGRSPEWIGPYQLDNLVQRTLAHLAGYDGQHSRLLKCDAAGVLKTNPEAPFEGRVAPASGIAYNAGAAVPLVIPLGAAAKWTVEILSSINSSVYESDDEGTPGAYLGSVLAGGKVWVRASSAYIVLTDPLDVGAISYAARWWAAND